MIALWRRTRYLAIAGCFPSWVALVLVAAFLLAIAERAVGGRSEAGMPMFLFLLPIAAGTGLLTRAKEGKLDLLLGAHSSRDQIWRAAFLRAAVVPIACAALLSPIIVPPGSPSSSFAVALLRTMAIASGLACVGFASGMVDPRYLAGVLWIALRITFAVTPWTFKLLAAVTTAAKGGAPLAPWQAIVVSLAIPELALDDALPLWIVAVFITLSAVAAIASRRWFLQAELSGKRLE